LLLKVKYVVEKPVIPPPTIATSIDSEVKYL